MVWFRDLGFHNNPFSIKPAVFDDKVIGYDKVIDEISYGILNNKVVILEGEYGNGKSTILRRLLNDFGGKKQVIYYSCNRIEARLNIKSLLNGRYGIFGKWFDMKPKDMILLLDEAQELGEKDYQKIHSYHQEGYLKSVVLVGKGIDKANIANGLKANITQVNLDQIDVNTAIKIIRRRVGALKLLPEEAIKEIFSLSENNVRLLLKNSEEACRFAVQTGRKTVNKDVLDHVFKRKGTPTKKIEPKKSPAKKDESKKEEKKPASKKSPAKKDEPKKEEKKPAPKKALANKEELKKEEVEKMAVPIAPSKGSSKKEGSKNVYNPEVYKDMMHSSAEELLDKGADELFE
jgi:energy-coupling factor transporter ATP-binding protein EcfA2